MREARFWLEHCAGGEGGFCMGNGNGAADSPCGSNSGHAGVDSEPLCERTNGKAEDASFQSRRRWPRFAVDMPVQVRVTTQGPTRVIACQGQGTDLSGGGLAVTADIDLPVGAQIGVEFIPPYSDQPIKFRCFIRNRDGSCYGVEFITENDDDYRKTGELQEGLAAMGATPRSSAQQRGMQQLQFVGWQ